MAIERTLSIIKPDAVARNLIGKIVARFEEEGLTIAAMRKVHLSLEEAKGFYAVHSERPFFGELTEYMSSAPSVVMVLEGDNAILRNREIMGATNPAEAAPGTLRALYAKSLGENSVHGSDAPETAAVEISYFFRSTELS
ncbi:MAG: nucleoside-diphosphate kinase [Myxococcota bacterium]|nr:nucleoside-diphosphate kinase [Myxococcota bacterium]